RHHDLAFSSGGCGPGPACRAWGRPGRLVRRGCRMRVHTWDDTGRGRAGTCGRLGTRRPPDPTPRRHRGLRRGSRRGIAAVELALLLPVLAFLLVATADFARVFYYGMALDSCARNGALYGRITTGDIPSQYASAQAAALADASANGLTPAPSV